MDWCICQTQHNKAASGKVRIIYVRGSLVNAPVLIPARPCTSCKPENLAALIPRDVLEIIGSQPNADPHNDDLRPKPP
jgi:hypothetical protein